MLVALLDKASAGFSFYQLRFVDGDFAFPRTPHVGIRRGREIAAYLAKLFADVALFRASVWANFRDGRGALFFSHASYYTN